MAAAAAAAAALDEPHEASRRVSGRKRGGAAGGQGSYFSANYEDESLHMLRCDAFGSEGPAAARPAASRLA